MKTRPLIFTAAVLMAASLGACSRSDHDAAPADNGVEATDTPQPPSAAAQAPEAAPSTGGDMPDEANASAEASLPAANAAAELPPPAPVDDQMMDDASATGMTARSSREEHPSNDAAAAPGETEPK